MGEIVCSMPGCPTTAGCRCGGFPYYPPQVPTITTGDTGSTFSASSAFSAGYRAALKDAAGAIQPVMLMPETLVSDEVLNAMRRSANYCAEWNASAIETLPAKKP